VCKGEKILKFQTTPQRSGTTASDLIVLPILATDLKTSSLLKRLDSLLHGNLNTTIHQEQFKGEVGETRLIATQGELKTRYLLMIGCGDEKSFKQDHLRQAGAKAARLAIQHQIKKMVWLPLQRKSLSKNIPIDCQAVTEGILLGLYQFTKYKKPKKASALTDILFAEIPKATAAITQKIREGSIVAEAIQLSRDLVNIPGNDMTPTHLGQAAKKNLKGVKVRLYNKKEIEHLKMGAYLSVAQGSKNLPVLIHMHYKPAGRSKGTVALVGKGVTFDSGGLSLKPPGGMETMKDDMAGSAAVIGAMKAIAALKSKVTVHAIVAATDNMPSGSATQPGDVVTAMNGKTIEILNTDAEGRLTLADALQFAHRFKPDVIIDTATLTGACVIALGNKYAGIMSNHQKLSDRLMASAQECGELMWPLPLAEEYKEELKSPIADLKNIGGRWGGTITAGLFLQEFVDPKIPWAHLDIAGSSWTDHDTDFCPYGGTGSMVATFTHFVQNYKRL
jgi:leucyl aminopeptidase